MLIYYIFKLKSCIKRFIEVVIRKKVETRRHGGKNLINAYDTQVLITEAILKNRPFMVARWGNEIRLCRDMMDVKYKLRKSVRKTTLTLLQNNTGYFSNNDCDSNKFTQLMEKGSRNTDVMGVFYHFMEDYYIHFWLSRSCKITNIGSVESSHDNNAWTRALEGKKVVVIHPFSKTIEMQYKKRKLIYPDGFLPEFELRTVKAVQTLAGNNDPRFKTWFQGLDFMIKEALKEDFDVAIIGCGAYGLPLASALKDAGKVAIHLGGATQIMFGIKGKRWDDHPVISPCYNEYWVYPSEDDKIKRFDSVEEGCYW